MLNLNLSKKAQFLIHWAQMMGYPLEDVYLAGIEPEPCPCGCPEGYTIWPNGAQYDRLLALTRDRRAARARAFDRHHWN